MISMKRIIRLPSPAMTVALLALFVALSGTAVAAGVVPLAKRAYTADNAGKLQGKSAAALVAQATALPSPASSAAGLVSVKTVPWTVAAGGMTTVIGACDTGQRAVSAGWEDPGGWAHEWDSRPVADATSWAMIITVSSQAPGTQSGSMHLVCLR